MVSEEVDMALDIAQEGMDQAIQHLNNELVKIRTGKASPDWNPQPGTQQLHHLPADPGGRGTRPHRRVYPYDPLLYEHHGRKPLCSS